MCCFDVAMSKCQVVKERTSQMHQLNTGVLKASKMYSTTVRRASQCSAQCLNEPNCFYITRDTAGTNCTLYTSGSISYDVSRLLTYAVQFKDLRVSNTMKTKLIWTPIPFQREI